MTRVIGIVFTLLVIAAAAYAFSPRPLPNLPATQTTIQNLLMLDAQPAGKRFVSVGERGRIFVSDDEGQHWRAVASPAQATLTGLYFLDDKRGWAVGHDAVILRTEDGGNTWQQVYSAPDEQRPLLDVWFADSRQGLALGAYAAFLQTSDGGKTWQPRKILDEDKHLNALARAADGALYIAGEAGTLLRSTDGGANWEPLASPYKGSFFGVLALKDGGVLAFGMRGNIFRSDDQGKTWKPVETGSQATLMGGRVLSDGAVMLVGQDGTLLLSRDHGRSFQQQKSPVSSTFRAVLYSANPEWLVFGEGGVTRIKPQTSAK